MNSSSVHLIGGGWDPSFAAAVYGPFLLEAAAVAGRTGRPGKPIIACVVYDEGDGRAQFARWEDVLTTVGFCEPVPVLVSRDAPLDVKSLGNADGLLICGGLTPGYAAAVTPAAVDVLDWLLLGDRPYAGFSAGSAIAAVDALVGGWQFDGVPVCPEDASEDLVDVTIRPGVGVVPFVVDVHCAQWGTLPRLICAMRAAPDGTGGLGVGIDENTVLIVGATGAVVRGAGQAWRVAGRDGSVVVTPFRDGDAVTVH
jgi:cyanophycinase